MRQPQPPSAATRAHRPVPNVAESIVEAAQAMHREGLVVATTGNVSARDGELRIRITPAAMPYELMTPEDVVVFERSGWSSLRQGMPSTEFRMHLAIYRARADINAIVHTHSPFATAWSFLGQTLDIGTEELDYYASGAVQTARFAETGSDEIGAAAVEALGDRRAVLLARHGVVGVGDTPAHALDVCRVIERQAQIAWILLRAR